MIHLDSERLSTKFSHKKEPQKLNGNLLNSIVRTVVSVTNVNYRPFYGLFEAW